MEKDEINEMREQIGILKEKIEHESIINDKMMRKVMNTNVDKLRVAKRMEYTCALVVIIIAPLSFRFSFGSSWTFIAATVLMMAVCMLATKRIYGPVTERDLMNGNLKDVAERMRKFKVEMKRWLWVGNSMIAVWIGWLEWEIYHLALEPDRMWYKHSLTIGVVIGLLVGMAVGMRMFMKALRNADEVIRQIEE
ncbi:MAG: hypothetical protein MJ002_08530 [Paludibacteraceae bacterium]|nr:hypothetical protein [Paludibacteraceae bacterium]